MRFCEDKKNHIVAPSHKQWGLSAAPITPAYSLYNHKFLIFFNNFYLFFRNFCKKSHFFDIYIVGEFLYTKK